MKRTAKRTRSASYESLEQRRLLAVTFVTGTVVVEGTSGNDAVSITRLDDSLELRSGGEVVESFSADEVRSIRFAGNGGDDSLVVEGLVGTTFEQFDFDGGDGNDQLTIQNSNVLFIEDLIFVGGDQDDQLNFENNTSTCLLYTSPSPRDQRGSRMPSSA